ncbi:hypothetical protein ACYPKM_35295 [Pseudomonas aeruginosa]
MRSAFDVATLQGLQEAGALRELRIVRHGELWGLQARLAARWVDVRSKREPIRTWASLDTLAAFCEGLQVKTITLEL